jgi:uncharacterized repeat protein (TIGR03803 family)
MPRSRFLTMMIVSFALLWTLASISPAQTVNTVVTFDGTNGANPRFGILAQGRDGSLYGTTEQGGVYGLGTVYRLQTNGTITVLHSFSGRDGSILGGGLTLGTDGNFYGAAALGGTNNWGTLFRISPTGTFTVLYNFADAADGALPVGAPILASDGNFYGLSQGYPSFSTVYKLTPSGGFSTIYTFSTSGYPFTQPYQDKAGNLWVPTVSSGTFGVGELAELTTAGVLKWSHSFNTRSGGLFSIGPVVQAPDGRIYGTTQQGGTHKDGTIYIVNPDGTLNFVYKFGSTSTDGVFPEAGLTLATDGNFYGTTDSGGSAAAGSLYQFSPSGTYQQLFSFSVAPDSAAPESTLVQHTNGMFYGTTGNGGGANGIVYSLDMGLGPFVTFVNSRGKVGQTAQILGQGLTGTTSVTFNGVPATSFKVVTDTYMTAVVPSGATTGKVVVTTPGGALTSNVNFRVVN